MSYQVLSFKTFVRDYLVAHFIFDGNEPIPIKPYAPKPEQDITFFPKVFVSISDQNNSTLLKAPNVSLFRQQVSRYNFHLTQEYLMFRVHFHPGALYRLLGIPLFEFTHQYSSASAIINLEVEDVNERLANCSDYTQMVQVVETCLIEQLVQAESYNRNLLILSIIHAVEIVEAVVPYIILLFLSFFHEVFVQVLVSRCFRNCRVFGTALFKPI